MDTLTSEFRRSDRAPNPKLILMQICGTCFFFYYTGRKYLHSSSQPSLSLEFPNSTVEISQDRLITLHFLPCIEFPWQYHTYWHPWRFTWKFRCHRLTPTEAFSRWKAAQLCPSLKCHYFNGKCSWNIDTNVLFYGVRVAFHCRIQQEGHRRENPLCCRSSRQEVLVTNNTAICTNAPPARLCLHPFTTALQQVMIFHFSVRWPVGPLFHPGSLDDGTVGFTFPGGWVN